MDLTMNSGGKLLILVAIVAIFGVAGWRLESPESFHEALADAGLAHQAAPAPASAPAVAPEAQPTAPAPQPPPQDSRDSNDANPKP